MSISKFQYAIYDKAIPIRVCNDIIKYGLAEKGNLGTIYSTGNNIKDIKNNTSKATKLLEKRDSNISWLDCPWIHPSSRFNFRFHQVSCYEMSL